MLGDGPTDAICLAGGSLLGLAAATGVAAELFSRMNPTPETIFETMPLVRGAIIFDFGRRDNLTFPDYELGRAAVRNAQTGRFPLGARGVGRSASVGAGLDWSGSEPSGQGAAYTQVGPTKVVVFTVVNAVGAIVNREGQVVRGHLNHETGQRRSLLEQVMIATPADERDRPTRNTTLTVVITNQKLTPTQLTQFGRQVHSSMARAIQPFHTGYDGDTLFTVTTAEVENPDLPTPALGVIAAEVAWDAVLSVVAAADSTL